MSKRVRNTTQRKRYTKGEPTSCMAGTCRQKVSDMPTHTELRRMGEVADRQDNDKAWAIIIQYSDRKLKWPAAKAALTEVGFTYRGYP